MATSTVPSIRNFEDALREYFALREDLTELERHEAECSCDVNEFHTCEFCRDYADKNHRAKSLIDLWGDAWAVQLGKLRAGEGSRTIDPAIDQESSASSPEPNFESRHGASDGGNPSHKLATVHHLTKGLEHGEEPSLTDQEAGDRFPGYICAPRAASRPTATDTAAEFARLLERRDLAAYRVVGAVETVILFWEAQDYDASLALLTRARSEFERTEIPIAEFRNSYKGELTRHGNRPAA